MDVAEERPMGHRRRPIALTAAAIVLVLIGATLVLPSPMLTTLFAGADCAMGSKCLDLRGLAVLGAAVTAAGIVHIAAGVGVWRERRWGRLLGGIVAAIGTVATGWPLALDFVRVGTSLWALLPLAYGACLVALWRWSSARKA